MIALAFVVALAAAPTKPNDDVIFFGVGASESCAAWLSSPAKETVGFAWILGFWSGLNGGVVFAGKRSDTGRTTDGFGVVGEVRKRCEKTPSSTPMKETMAVFGNFYNTER